MKKILFTNILLMLCFIVYGQSQGQKTIMAGTLNHVTANLQDSSKLQFDTDSTYTIQSENIIRFTDRDNSQITISKMNNTFDGTRPITRAGSFLGITPGGDNLVDFLNNLLYPTTSPTAAINVTAYGTSKEFASAGTDAITVNWSVTRPASCLALASVVVRGKTITPTPNPAEGATYSSTLDTTIVRNTNTTFTITATTTDAKTGTASTTVTWYWKRYWGAFASAVAPTDPSFSISNAEILALTGSELSTTYVKTFGTVSTSGNYFVYAFPTAWGTPKFFINGFETAFIKVKSAWSFTNASGGTANYDVWCSPFEYSSSFTLTTTN